MAVSGFLRRECREFYNYVVTPGIFAMVEEPVDHLWFHQGELPVMRGVGRLVPAKNFYPNP